jgi:hypothetical protein
VSTYLSSFLSDVGDFEDRDSGSESDDSFYSYSARIEHPQSSRDQLSAGQIPLSPTTAQLKTFGQKQSTRERVKPRQHPKRAGDGDNGRNLSRSLASGSIVKARKRSVASLSDYGSANSLSLKGSFELSNEASGVADVALETPPRPEIRDAVTQTLPLSDSGLSTCPICQSMILSKSQPKVPADFTVAGKIDLEPPSPRYGI